MCIIAPIIMSEWMTDEKRCLNNYRHYSLIGIMKTIIFLLGLEVYKILKFNNSLVLKFYFFKF